MNTEIPEEFESGDAILILGTNHDGKVGTVLRPSDDENHYLIVLEDGTEVILSANEMALRY
jgi:hypothetical protein